MREYGREREGQSSLGERGERGDEFGEVTEGEQGVYLQLKESYPRFTGTHNIGVLCRVYGKGSSEEQRRGVTGVKSRDWSTQGETVSRKHIDKRNGESGTLGGEGSQL